MSNNYFLLVLKYFVYENAGAELIYTQSHKHMPAFSCCRPFDYIKCLYINIELVCVRVIVSIHSYACKRAGKY